MTSKHLIYGLFDPRDGQLRYIGKSSSGLARPKEHLEPGRLALNKSWSGNWIRKLIRYGLKYRISVIQEFAGGDHLNRAEMYWIAYFRQAGCRLTNVTNGGEGVSGLPRSAATRAKISASSKGRQVSQETRAKIGAANKGKTRSLELRSRLSAANTGHKDSPETKAKKSLATKGKPRGPRSAETILNMSRGAGGRPFMDVDSGKVFQTQREASVFYGISNVGAVLRRVRKSASGHVFVYVG